MAKFLVHDGTTNHEISNTNAVSGPGSSTDNIVPVFDGTTGKKLKTPTAGDTSFGSASVTFAIQPRFDLGLNLGKLARRFFDGHFGGQVSGIGHMYAFSDVNAISSDTAMDAVGGIPTGATTGYVMHRPGSIIGIGYHFGVTAETTPGTVDGEVLVDGVLGKKVTLTTSGVATYSGSDTFTRGEATFAAGDILAANNNFQTFVGTFRRTIFSVQVVFDT